MTPAEVTTILRQFNGWRRDLEDKFEQPDSREIGEAIDAAIEMIESAEENRALCDKLAGILTRTANVLKGDPKPLHRHGWHDLPDVAQKIVAARAAGSTLTGASSGSPTSCASPLQRISAACSKAIGMILRNAHDPAYHGDRQARP